MKNAKTEIKNRIDGKDPVATYYGGLAELGLELYGIDDSEEVIYFVEIAGMKKTPKKSRVFVKDNGRVGFRWGHRVVWLDECIRTNWNI